jgi:proteic killer suppression protein
VIQSFKDENTAELFLQGRNRRWANIASVAIRKLDMLHSAVALNDLPAPPGNRLEALTGDRKGQHSIRISNQYRICFVWHEDGVVEVEITDYH